MKRIAILLASLISALSLSAQAGGREVLTMVAERLAKMGAYRIDFELEMSSAAETSKGHCMVSGPLYLIAIDGVGGMDGMKQGLDLRIFRVSAKTGEGMASWLDWLKQEGK